MKVQEGEEILHELRPERAVLWLSLFSKALPVGLAGGGVFLINNYELPFGFAQGKLISVKRKTTSGALPHASPRLRRAQAAVCRDSG